VQRRLFSPAVSLLASDATNRMADYDSDMLANSPDDHRPTYVRHFVVLATMAMAMLLYLDRFCVAFAAEYIREDLNLTQSQMADFLGAFFWSYALAQVPSGWLSDRYGARIMLVVYILSWSLFTALIGAATSFALLLSVRLISGLGQAGAYPTSASVVSKWVPFSNRGMASSLIAFGGRVGGFIAPLLTAFLILVFVPLSTPTELKPKELLHGPRLAAKLAPAESETELAEGITVPGKAGVHIWSLLPGDVRPALIAAANEFRERETALLALKETVKSKPTAKAKKAAQTAAESLEAMELSADDKEQLLAAVNSLLTEPNLYSKQAFENIKLERETRKYVEKAEGGDNLNDLEQRRLNRFLLEAAFRSEIGKLYVKGWRPVMYVYGAAGLLVAGFFWICVRNRPEAHPWANAAECRLISSGRPAGAPSPHGKPGTVPIMALLKSVSMWADCFMQVGTNVGWVFLVLGLPRYLEDVHHVPLLQRGVMSAIPLGVGFVGMLIGGKLTDVLTSRLGVKWGRRGPMMFTRFTAAGAYVICLALSHSATDSIFNSPWAFVIVFSLVAMSTDMGTPAGWAFKQDVGGRYVGSVLGWGNMWGNLGAACSPRIYDYFLGETPTIDDWNNMFLVCMGAFIFAGLCGLLIDATKMIAPPDDEHEDEK
jgi:MFS transporter, ACS family, glucarate transporter